MRESVADCLLTINSVLYVHKVNPTLWEDVNLVESFGFLSMCYISVAYFLY